MPTLTWLTREEDIKVSGQVPYRILEPVVIIGSVFLNITTRTLPIFYAKTRREMFERKSKAFLNEQKNFLSEKTIDSPCAAGDTVENCFNYVNHGKEQKWITLNK